jgi:hypothetical protein
MGQIVAKEMTAEQARIERFKKKMDPNVPPPRQQVEVWTVGEFVEREFVPRCCELDTAARATDTRARV